MMVDITTALPTDEHFHRNLIGGEWSFPTAPYEFEIRNPVDSTITTEVPLSSRLDVDRAIKAARQALSSEWADPTARRALLARLLDRVTELAPDLAALQAVETGVAGADSIVMLEASIGLAREHLIRTSDSPTRPGVSGHVLSWGLPATEMLLGVVTALADGMTVVVKPSLRGPLSPVAFAYLAESIGFPAGVINVVQGTGVDAGAALISSDQLDRLSVHGNDNTLSRAQRAFPFTGVPLATLRAGGNAAIVHPDATSADIADFASQVAAAVRVNSAGSLFGLHSVAVHTDRAAEVREALVAAVARLYTAPLPNELQRRKTMSRVYRLRAAGCELLCGGTEPNNIKHRMGWFVKPTVVDLGPARRALPLLDAAGSPLGPVVTVAEWATVRDIDALFTNLRHRDAYGAVWGDDGGHNDASFGVRTRAQGPLAAARSGLVPSAWIGASFSEGLR